MARERQGERKGVSERWSERGRERVRDGKRAGEREHDRGPCSVLTLSLSLSLARNGGRALRVLVKWMQSAARPSPRNVHLARTPN